MEVIGAEDVYQTAFGHDVDGAIVVAASHDSIGYNGMILVRSSS